MNRTRVSPRWCRVGRLQALPSYTNTVPPFSEQVLTPWQRGGGVRELYGNQWSATTKAKLLLFDNLHYHLMPYLYSLAWKVTSESYTIIRPLVFDFQSDTKVYDIKDQFMYGPALAQAQLPGLSSAFSYASHRGRPILPMPVRHLGT